MNFKTVSNKIALETNFYRTLENVNINELNAGILFCLLISLNLILYFNLIK